MWKITFAVATASLLIGVSSGVSAKAPPGRYTITARSVKDNRTKLTWQRFISPSKFTYADALTHCDGLEDDNATDWRVPSKAELESLVDHAAGYGEPPLDPEAFPDAPKQEYWSATWVAYASSSAWTVHFADKATRGGDVSSAYAVRCVR